MHFSVQNSNPNTKVWVTEQAAEPGLLYAQVHLEGDSQQLLKPFSDSFSIPFVDVHSVWSPRTEAAGMRKLGLEWNK